MYRIEQLIKYKFFAEQIEKTGLDHMTDPLTGLISRAYILDFARSLIADNIPFSFAMLDLDNFKFINDTYGHGAGDEILRNVSTCLMDYIDGFGVAGRFGGDEFLIIDLRDIKYDEKKAFFNDLYTDGKVLRRNYDLADCSPFVTGTLGCATFPDNTTDYDELFSMIDKTLYRGKNKGRNCYIIYVEEKHKNIVIKRMAGHGICTVMQSLIRQFEFVPGTDNRFHSVLPLLMDELGISDLYYTDKNGIMHAVLKKSFSEDVSDIDDLTKDDVYCTNNIEEVEERSPLFYRALNKHEMETLLVTRIGMKEETDGYLICAEPRSHRIWQEDECAVIYFLTKLVAVGMRLDGDSITE
ncbi:MAG: GGDEF domain-containing protein [Ruminiclostridium sp.]|nr:GGDEF domain-containing protein [Ruminiclostridium sp.]